MKLLNFINLHRDWEEILTNPPYNLSVKRDGEYFLLKYNMIESNLSDPLVQEARGSIFWFNENNNRYECVCHPFDKFFNYGEPNAAEIDWTSASIQEKIDGSLIKFWYHNGKWHISTNGTIDAYKAEVEDFDGSITFGELVDSVLGENKEEFMYSLFSNCTHMFELVTPINRLVVDYGDESKLYYLGSRNNEDKEINYIEYFKVMFPYLSFPKTYDFNSLKETVAFAATLDKDEEGYVVCDKWFHRIKIKGAGYLEAFHIRGNGKLTKKRIVEAILKEYIDDVASAFPEKQNQIDEVLIKFADLMISMAHYYNELELQKYETRKEQALIIKEKAPNSLIQSYCFAQLSHPDMTIISFLRQYNLDKLVEYV